MIINERSLTLNRPMSPPEAQDVLLATISHTTPQSRRHLLRQHRFETHNSKTYNPHPTLGEVRGLTKICYPLTELPNQMSTVLDSRDGGME